MTYDDRRWQANKTNNNREQQPKQPTGMEIIPITIIADYVAEVELWIIK